MNALSRFFDIEASETTVGRELMAGVTTFLTMAYILFVNPSILGVAIPVGQPQLLTTTALAAAAGCIFMAVIAKHPIALAPGMGLNAYFAFSVVKQGQATWQVALAAVFFSGILFLLLSVTGARSMLVDAIPRPLRQATAGGIGLFLAFIGLKNAGMVVSNQATFVALGEVNHPGPVLFLVGLIVTGVLLAFRVRVALLAGIGLTSLVAIVAGLPVYQGKAFPGFEHGIIAAPVWPSDLFMALDFSGVTQIGLLGVVFVFFFVDLFDTAGTLGGLTEEGGLADGEGKLPRIGKAFTADALATTVGALFGTSTTTAYVESVAGIKAGGRTGLTALVVGGCFLLSLVLWPLAGAVPAVATAPALVIVGSMMIPGLSRIDWSEPTISIPAFLTAVLMPLSFSIANGVAAGIVTWVVINLVSRKQPVPPLLVVVAAFVVARYIWLGLA